MNHVNIKVDDKAGPISVFFIFIFLFAGVYGLCVLLPLIGFVLPFVLALQEFSFSQVWASSRHPLQCAFFLERYSQPSSQLSCKISVRQVKGEEQILQVYTSVLEVRGARVGAANELLLSR